MGKVYGGYVMAISEAVTVTVPICMVCDCDYTLERAESEALATTQERFPIWEYDSFKAELIELEHS